MASLLEITYHNGTSIYFRTHSDMSLSTIEHMVRNSVVNLTDTDLGDDPVLVTSFLAEIMNDWSFMPESYEGAAHYADIVSDFQIDLSGQEGVYIREYRPKENRSIVEIRELVNYEHILQQDEFGSIEFLVGSSLFEVMTIARSTLAFGEVLELLRLEDYSKTFRIVERLTQHLDYARLWPRSPHIVRHPVQRPYIRVQFNDAQSSATLVTESDRDGSMKRSHHQP